MDEDGYFFIVDRLKRMINATGFKVWPAEVEALLYKHPAIQEACVIARPRRPPRRDASRPSSCSSAATRRAGDAREEIIAWAREHMAAYKVPRVVEFVDALPKSGTGKVLWRALQEREDERGGSGA